jgi:hypothetical protein
MNAITTRRTLARQPAAPPAIRQTIDVAPPVAAKFVAPPEPHQPLISTRALDVVLGVLFGALFGYGLAVLTWWAC